MTKHVQAFIAANRSACKAAFAVFNRIESEDFTATLAGAGITGPDIRVFATIYVADKTGVNPHPSQRGGSLVFKKDSPEYNRVKYLVSVASGVRESKAAAERPKYRVDAALRVAANKFLGAFKGKTHKARVAEALRVLNAMK